MTKFILALLPAAMLFTGCENACDTGFVLKSKLQTLETTVLGTISSPESLTNSCTGFRATSNRELLEGANFAARVAHDYFYSEQRFCRTGHNVQQCGTQYGPQAPAFPRLPGNPGFGCQNYFVCDSARVVGHKKDGYDDAMELSSLLTSTEGNLSGGCSAHDRGADIDALSHLVQAKSQIHQALDSAEVVLTKAGCYERRGD